MKLYTEEQLIKAIDLARLQGSEPFLVKHREEEILNMLVSIELPNDEEIWNEADKEESISKHYAFTRGARYVIDKIQGGNSEQ